MTPDERALRKQMEQERQNAERRYLRALRRLLGHVDVIVQGAATPQEACGLLEALTLTPQYRTLADEAAQRMATLLAVGQRTTWRRAAAASSKGRLIYKALRRENATSSAVGLAINDIVAQNARLISSVPHDVASELSQLALKRTQQGLRPDAIMEEIRRRAPELSERQARTIARTESSKASTALVEARSRALGLDLYEWSTMGDGILVRPSHRIMDGVICSWSDPPSPERLAGERDYGAYHPGNIFNCRCIALPVMSLSDIHYPCKAYSRGKIHNVRSAGELAALFGYKELTDQ